MKLLLPIDDVALATYLKTDGEGRHVLEARIAALTDIVRELRDSQQRVLERCGELKEENRTLKMQATPEAAFLYEVMGEVRVAREKYPVGTQRFCPLIGEVGEVANAINKGEGNAAIRKELLQSAAMCVRMAVEGDAVVGFRGDST